MVDRYTFICDRYELNTTGEKSPLCKISSVKFRDVVQRSIFYEQDDRHELNKLDTCKFIDVSLRQGGRTPNLFLVNKVENRLRIKTPICMNRRCS